MKKMKLFMSAALSLAMLTGCASSSSVAPATEAPTTEAPATTVAPTTEEPTTEAPTTEAPTTEEPTTEAPKAATPVEYYGEMIAKNSKIYGSKTDEPMRVTGMSFFWSNWSQKYYTADYVDYLVDDYGCEIVRCSYGIQDNGTPHDKSCEPLIENVIEEAIEKGVYVVIDWHAHGAHKNPEEAKAYFGALAEKYGSYDNVIFELYNEPTNVDWAGIKTYAEEVIPVIREHSDNLIIVGTPNWSQQVDKAAADPIDDENVAYTLHFYAGTHKQWLRDTADKAMAKGLSLVVTEWGSVNADGNGAIAKESTEEWFKWIDDNMLSSCNWAVNDKAEGSSIFSKDSELSDTGEYIKQLIAERTQNAPWR